MKALDAAEVVLREAAEPLHYRELTRRMLDRGLWTTTGKTPWETINSRINENIKLCGSSSRFRREGSGHFAVNEPRRIQQNEYTEQEPEPSRSTMSFIDAAAEVLPSSGEPMHYTAITQAAINRGLIQTEGRTPAATMSSLLGTDIRQRESRGEQPRFVKLRKGWFALAESAPLGLATEIGRHNKAVREELKARLHEMPPMAFEELIAALLAKMGFEEVERTQYSGDGGIDAMGTLDVGGVARVQVAVQAKRLQSNVLVQVVREVRGTVGARQGVIITTSDFSKGAREEAERTDAAPVALVNGEHLIDLLIRHEIGVSRTQYELLTPDELPGTEA